MLDVNCLIEKLWEKKYSIEINIIIACNKSNVVR